MQEVVSRHGVHRSMDSLTTHSSLITMLVNEIDAGKNAMIDCITDIELCTCRSHTLKLNADKSDVIWLGSRQQLAKLSLADKDVHLWSGSLRASETARNLGVIIDQHLTFEAQTRVCSNIIFGAYDKLNGSLTTHHCSYWYRHSLSHAWTIVTHYWQTAVWLCIKECNESMTVLPVCSAQSQLVAMLHH